MVVTWWRNDGRVVFALMKSWLYITRQTKKWEMTANTRVKSPFDARVHTYFEFSNTRARVVFLKLYCLYVNNCPWATKPTRGGAERVRLMKALANPLYFNFSRNIEVKSLRLNVCPFVPDANQALLHTRYCSYSSPSHLYRWTCRSSLLLAVYFSIVCEIIWEQISRSFCFHVL